MSEEKETIVDIIRAIFITFAVIYVPLRLIHFIFLPTFISTNQITGAAFLFTAAMVSIAAYQSYTEEEKNHE